MAKRPQRVSIPDRDLMEADPERDAEELVRAVVESSDGDGPLRLEVRAWAGHGAVCFRYALRVDKGLPENAMGPLVTTWKAIAQPCHPFSCLAGANALAAGGSVLADYVADNDVTRALVRLIALSDHELGQLSGTSGAAGYRARLIGCLKSLWD